MSEKPSATITAIENKFVKVVLSLVQYRRSMFVGYLSSLRSYLHNVLSPPAGSRATIQPSQVALTIKATWYSDALLVFITWYSD